MSEKISLDSSDINSLMENYKEKHKSHMATCHSPFADVYKYQSVNGDDEEKQSGIYGYMSISPFAEV